MNKAAIAAGLVAAMTTAHAASAETLIASTGNPPTHFAVVHGFDPFMTCVKEKSGGELDFNFFPSGQIANNAASLDVLTNGLSQISYVTPTFVSDKMPLTNITSLPNMGLTSTQMNKAWRKVIEDGGPIADELKANNIVVLYVHAYPPYQLGLRDRKVETLADFSGQKIRVSGGSQVFAVNSLSAVPVQIGGGDTYVAMQQGTVDGYMLALTSVESYKLQEVSQSITTNVNFAGAVALLAMDATYFEGLSAEKQTALTDCGAEIEKSVVEFQDGYIAELEQKFAAAGAEMYAVPDETLVELNKTLELAVDDYIKRLTDIGLPAQEALEQYRAALAAE